MANVKLSWNASSGQTFKVEYKKTVDSTWTQATIGLVALTYTVVGLVANTSYDFRVTSSCPSGGTGTPVTVTTTTEEIYIWIEDTFVCEQDQPFSLDKTVSGFKSPQSIYWDVTTSRYYVVDVDDAAGNVYYFNPDTMNNYSDRVVIPGVAFDYIGSNAYDSVNRKIWAAGNNTNGVLVVDIATNSLQTTVNYGVNGSLTRILVRIFGDTVYCSSALGPTSNADMVLINKNTATISSVIPSSSIIQASNFFNRTFQLFTVEGKIWSVCSQRTAGTIGIYNSDLTGTPNVITLPSSTIWSGGLYWQSHYYDEEKKKFYSHDSGSNRWYIIDTLTNTVISNKVLLDRGGKSGSSFSFVKNELTGDLYMSGAFMNSPSDTVPINRTYKINRDTGDIEYMYIGQKFNNLRLRPGTNELWGVDQGLISPSADGFLLKYLG